MWRVALFFEPVLDARPASSALLTPGELARAGLFVREQDRHRFLVTHELLRHAVADLVGTRPADVEFDFTCHRCGEQHGRPRVVGGAGGRDVSVSLSRSDGASLIAVLVAPPGERAPSIGVDLERVRAVDFDGFDDVALTAAERAPAVPAVPIAPTASRAAFWVRKEAVAKAHGSGLRLDPRSIDVAGSGSGSGLTVLDGRSFAWLDVEVPLPGSAAALAVADTPPDAVAPELRPPAA